MTSRSVALVVVALVGEVSVVAALKTYSAAAASREVSRESVLSRMEWWAKGAGEKPTNDRYLLFTPDAGGPNNIRIGWEMSAVVAQRTNRTFVLPPASKMYLLDFGPRTNWHGSLDDTTTRIEDLINLAQLKAVLPTLTAEEFEAKVGKSWSEAKDESAEVDDDHVCMFDAYNNVDGRMLYMPGDGRREGFSCGEWWKLGGPRDEMRADFQDSEWALLTHGFVWHPDAFAIASHAVSHMGIFNYNALHARYNDFQFHEAQQGAEDIVGKWGKYLGGRDLTLYIASDEPQKFADNDMGNVRLEFMRHLFGENGDSDSDAAPLADVRKQYSAERWFKMMGPAEELICTFAQVFVGTQQSSFSGHIQRMRLHAQAPVTMVLTHTMPINDQEITTQLTNWKGALSQDSDFTSGFHQWPLTQGDSFFQHAIKPGSE